VLILLVQSSDFILKAAEKTKFRKDLNSIKPIATYSTMRFVPLALNHFGLRGPHFQAVLKEFATIVVTRPEGCSLLQGPFAFNSLGSSTQDYAVVGIFAYVDITA
jgi:hypothetical protein